MGKYKRKTQRQSWDENSMRQAIEEALEGRMGYLKASRQYEVPRTTMEARNTTKDTTDNTTEDTPPRTLPTSPLRKSLSITTNPTKQFHANSTPSCSNTTQNFVVTPPQVVPVPNSERKLNLNDRRRGKTAVLTSTPYKQELEESIGKRLTKKPKLNFGDTEKAAHIVKLNEKGKINDNEMTTRKDIKAKNPKKKYSGSSEETSVREKRQKYTGENESEEATAIFCSELYPNSKAEEGWIRCQHCEGWTHEACAGAGEGEDKVFIYDFCQ
ncbi:hypothetical protein JTB14_004029 [Gonioctena quinquepunctata]|nr:hypothetical protein JTB14_004029 [Gonioctena quinquepunctata]